MGAKKTIVLPKTEKILERMGGQIKLARLRRNLSMRQISERANISRTTLWQVEKGSPSISIGTYAAVLQAIGNCDTELLKILEEDELGRTIQDLGIITPKRGRR